MRGLLNRQSGRDGRLGEMLVRMGLIDEAELRAMLSLQAELRAAGGGGIRALATHRFRLGRLLLDSGIIDEATLNDALARQRRLTKVAIASAALSTLIPGPATAGDTAHVSVVATVLARAAIESQRLPRDIAITQQDIERGYVDLEPVEIGVQSNNPSGVRLGFAANSVQLAAVDVDGGGSILLIAQPARGLQRQRVSVRLRLRLAPSAVPGTIAFPVSVYLTPA